VTEFSQSGGICQSDAAYVLGALSPADRRAFEDHLRDCAGCRDSVQRLAGMPGLLALTTAETLRDSGPSVPDSLLPGLLARAESVRRRRGWIVGGLLAASIALILALAGTLVLRTSADNTAGSAPSSTTATTPPVEPEQMTQVLAGPMTASLELVGKKWGTAITVVCRYDQDVDTSTPYDLAVVDTDGNLTSAGTWRAVPGVTARVVAATAVPLDRIAALEVQLPDGQTILRYDE
jgi:anti-sigma-K factor RskA